MLRQLCNDASDTVLIENNEMSQEWVATQSGVTLLFSMRTVLLVSSHICLSIDADTWCKRALNNMVMPMFLN